MADFIQITALNIRTKIGVNAWEQRILQQVLIDVHIPLDMKHCQDDISKTINYETLCAEITTHVESKSFKLIETIANEVAELILKKFQAQDIKVTVAKPHAIKNAGMVSVTVVR